MKINQNHTQLINFREEIEALRNKQEEQQQVIAQSVETILDQQNKIKKYSAIPPLANSSNSSCTQCVSLQEKLIVDHGRSYRCRAQDRYATCVPGSAQIRIKKKASARFGWN